MIIKSDKMPPKEAIMKSNVYVKYEFEISILFIIIGVCSQLGFYIQYETL